MRRTLLISTALVLLPLGAATAQQSNLSPDQYRKNHGGHLSNGHNIGNQKPNIPNYVDKPEGVPQVPAGGTGPNAIPPIGSENGNHKSPVPKIGGWTGDSSGPVIPEFGHGHSKHHHEHHNEIGVDVPGSDSGTGEGSSYEGHETADPEPMEYPEWPEHHGATGGQQSAGQQSTSNNNNNNSNTSGTHSNSNNTNTNTNNNKNNGGDSSSNSNSNNNNNGNGDKDKGGSGASSGSNSNNSGGKPDVDTGKGGKGDDDSMVTPDYDPGTPGHEGQYYSKPGNGQPTGDPDDTQTTGKGSPNPDTMLHNPNQVRPNGEGSTNTHSGSHLPRVNGSYDPADGSAMPGTGTATPTNIPEHPGTEGH